MENASQQLEKIAELLEQKMNYVEGMPLDYMVSLETPAMKEVILAARQLRQIATDLAPRPTLADDYSNPDESRP